MKSRFIVLAPILGATVFVGANAQAACNARQEFCTYPTWAANSFSSQGGQKPRFASGYPESYLAPDITDYGYGPVFAYAPTYGSASAYGYGPAYGYAPTYRSAAADGYDPVYGSAPTHRYVAADTYGPVFYPSAAAYGYGPAYGYAPTRRYAPAYGSGRAYGYVARRTNARDRRDWRWPSPGWPTNVKK